VEPPRTFLLGAALGLFVTAAAASTPKATIIDTGSTNTAGMRVTVNAKGQATVSSEGAQPRVVDLSQPVCRLFMEHVKGAAPLDQLPQVHCAKSVSFGTRLFVEYKGTRSPDLSCPAEQGAAAALEKDAREILRSARQALGLPPNGMPARHVRRIER
jgi:hypothetical protein